MKSYNLEAMRRSVGLPLSQWMRFLGASQDADLYRNGFVTWETAHRAERIAEMYDEFRSALKAKITANRVHARFSVDGVPHFSTVQAAMILGIGGFHLTNLRKRGRVHGYPVNARAHGFSVADLHHLIDVDAAEEANENNRFVGALAGPFIAYLEERLTGASGMLWDVPYEGPWIRAYDPVDPAQFRASA